jgi:hypothetical protein
MVLRQRGSGRSTGDGGGSDAPPTARWLAFAAACLLVAALVSAGVVGFDDGPSSDAIVSAAGRTASTVALPSTVTVAPPSTFATPPAPTSTIRTTTTLPRAAVAVLNAIGTTAPPTTAPAPTAPPTTRSTTTVPPPTTTTTPPRVARVKVTNAYGQFLRVAVDGSNFTLDRDQSVGPVAITLPTGDDFIEVRTAGDPPCTAQGSADYFQPGGNYQVTIVAGTGTPCADGLPTPVIEVTPA